MSPNRVLILLDPLKEFSGEPSIDSLDIRALAFVSNVECTFGIVVMVSNFSDIFSSVSNIDFLHLQ